MTDQQAQPLTDEDTPQAQGAAPLSPLVRRLIYYCECVDAIRDEGNNYCCDFRKAAALIANLQAQLAQPRGWICKQCFAWVLTREAHKPCQSCFAPWELQHPLAALAAQRDTPAKGER